MFSSMVEGIWQCKGCGQTYAEYVNGCPKHDDGVRRVVLIVPEAGKPMAQVLGAECSRCYGTGEGYDEVFAYEWTPCPYFDVDAGVACLNGRIVPIDEAMP